MRSHFRVIELCPCADGLDWLRRFFIPTAMLVLRSLLLARALLGLYFGYRFAVSSDLAGANVGIGAYYALCDGLAVLLCGVALNARDSGRWLTGVCVVDGLLRVGWGATLLTFGSMAPNIIWNTLFLAGLVVVSVVLGLFETMYYFAARSPGQRAAGRSEWPVLIAALLTLSLGTCLVLGYPGVGEADRALLLSTYAFALGATMLVAALRPQANAPRAP